MINLDLNPKLEKKLKIILGDDQNRFFDKILTMEIANLKKAIKNIQHDIILFEKKYGIASTAFYKQWQAGKFGDENNDFFEWSGEIELLDEIKKKLNKLVQ